MITEAQQVLIDRYLQGRLTPKEQKEFSLLRRNAEFEKELEIQSNLQLAIRWQNREALQPKIAELNRKKLAAFRTSYRKVGTEYDRKKNVVVWHKGFPIAATIALAIIAGTYFWQTANTDSAIIEHVALAGTAKGEDTEEVEAFEAYDQRAYSQAKQLFSEIPDDGKSDKELFYHAMTLLLLNQQEAHPQDVEQAIRYLEQLRSGRGNYQEIAEWHFALALLVQGNEDKAKVILSEIAQKTHPYSEEAQKKLRQL